MSEIQLQLSGAFERDLALEKVRKGSQVWIDTVGAPVLYRFLERNLFFTTDDVWEYFDSLPSPRERRVMGALIRGFALKGFIVKTGRTEKSLMPSCHARDKAVWRSELFKGVKT